jgi:hypothetical protein
MKDWMSFLKRNPIEWLLEEENPSVRYFTLTGILERDENDSQVLASREAIMRVGVVPKILAKQKSGGYWGKPKDFYIRGKYKGTVWTFILLAELSADGGDKLVRNACEFILNNSQNKSTGGFSYMNSSGEGGDYEKTLPCLSGNMIWSLIRFGYLEDPRIQKGIEWIVKYQTFDDGTGKPKGWPYDNRKPCYGKHTCHMGAAKALKALAEILPQERSYAVNRKISEGAEYFLKHHIYKRSHDLTQVSKPYWLEFGFPLMASSDTLEMADILTKLGYRDKRMKEAIDLIISKQDNSGKWNLERTYNGRYQARIEQQGKPSKWITLRALKVLKRFYANCNN